MLAQNVDEYFFESCGELALDVGRLTGPDTPEQHVHTHVRELHCVGN
ncbi:hypothetical protein C7402_109284 [Paraburkholderia unamae]|uniref:Uncharacterized protein n=1 Tax=Paraburkholderia unamae TaxID=219649 RepID=A0ABX5KKN8_9BURK|nr:hypothetical protein C7402_109284 [Paraburkholderia unamae]